MPVCRTKLSLLRSYMASLDTHNHAVREYVLELQVGGLDSENLPKVKDRFMSTLEEFRATRKTYTDHLEEHGC